MSVHAHVHAGAEQAGAVATGPYGSMTGCGGDPGASGRPYPRDVEDATPVSTQETVGTSCEPPANLAVEPFSLPLRHRDVPGEGVQQVDVALRVVHGLPVGLTSLDDVEQPAGLDVASIIVQLLRTGHRRARRQGFADLVVHLLELLEEGIAVVGDDMPRTPQGEMAARLQHRCRLAVAQPRVDPVPRRGRIHHREPLPGRVPVLEAALDNFDTELGQSPPSFRCERAPRLEAG